MTATVDVAVDHVNRVWDDIVPVLHDYIAIPNVSPVVRSRVGVERLHAAGRRSDRRVVPQPADPGPHGRGAPAPGPDAADRRRGARRSAVARPTTRCCCTATSTSNPRWKGGATASDRGRRCSRATGSTGAAAPTMATPRSPASRPSRRPRRRRGDGTRCVVLIEASEESGSPDLPAYVDALADAHRPTESRRVPRLRLHRLRPDVGHDLAARPRGRGAVGRHRHRGPPLGRRLGDDPVELPHRSVAALPDRGRGDRRHPVAGVGGRDSRRPCARGAGDGGGDRLGSPTATRSSTMPARPPTTPSSNSCREPGDRR